MKRIFFLSGLIVLLFFCDCKEKKGDFKTVNVEEFDQLLETQLPQLLDISTGYEFSEGHIPGALNANVMDDSFELHIDYLLDKDVPVAIYCSKTDKRTTKAANILSEKGFKVFVLASGLQEWVKAGKDYIK